jgi:hypothetical protein
MTILKSKLVLSHFLSSPVLRAVMWMKVMVAERKGTVETSPHQEAVLSPPRMAEQQDKRKVGPCGSSQCRTRCLREKLTSSLHEPIVLGLFLTVA